MCRNYIWCNLCVIQDASKKWGVVFKVSFNPKSPQITLKKVIFHILMPVSKSWLLFRLLQHSERCK